MQKQDCDRFVCSTNNFMHICAWKVCLQGLLTDLCLSSDSERDPCSVVILSNQPEWRFTLSALILLLYHPPLSFTKHTLILISVCKRDKQTNSTENIRPPQLGLNVHLHSCVDRMHFSSLCLQSRSHLVSRLGLSISPLFPSGMQRWPSGPAHLWEQSAISPRPCSDSKHLASFGRFVDFCPLVFSLLLL